MDKDSKVGELASITDVSGKKKSIRPLHIQIEKKGDLTVMRDSEHLWSRHGAREGREELLK